MSNVSSLPFNVNQMDQLERELKTGFVQDIIDRFSLDACRQEDLAKIWKDASQGVTFAMHGWSWRKVCVS